MLTEKNKSILNFSHEVLPGLNEDSVFCPDILKLYEKKKKTVEQKKLLPCIRVVNMTLFPSIIWNNEGY